MEQNSRQCGSNSNFTSHLPMGNAFRIILWLPRVYSMSTVIGAEYVMSLKRHWNKNHTVTAPLAFRVPTRSTVHTKLNFTSRLLSPGRRWLMDWTGLHIALASLVLPVQRWNNNPRSNLLLIYPVQITSLFPHHHSNQTVPCKSTIETN